MFFNSLSSVVLSTALRQSSLSSNESVKRLPPAGGVGGDATLECESLPYPDYHQLLYTHTHRGVKTCLHQHAVETQ